MLLWSILIGCGDKCPDGYEVNEQEKACYLIEQDTGNATDTDDTSSTETDDTSDTDTEDTGTTVDPFADLDRLNGKIIIPSLFEGRLIPRAAFWYQVDEHFLLYMAANSSATCELVADHLSSGDRPDPTNLFIQDHCNVGIYLDDVNNIDDVSFFNECSFGEGSFGNSTGSWKWTGTDENGLEAEFFIGAGLIGGVLDFQEDNDRRALQMEVTEWAGNFPYSNTYNTSGAVGTGNGFIIATECAAMESTSYLTESGNDN